jgi:hypothetical protein
VQLPQHEGLSACFEVRKTMGQLLDELMGVGYLGSWQLQPMTRKKGLEFVLTPVQGVQRDRRGNTVVAIRVSGRVPVAVVVDLGSHEQQRSAGRGDRQTLVALLAPLLIDAHHRYIGSRSKRIKG